MKHVKYYLMVAITFFIIGYVVCKNSVEEEIITTTIKEKPIEDSVNIPKPYQVQTPDDIQLPVKQDTIYSKDTLYVIQKVDTAQIIRDYILIKDYSINLFDNKYGKLDITQKLQYNAIQSLSYKYTPITTQTTIYKKYSFKPFISTNYSTFNIMGLGGGLIKDNIGLQYNYQYDLSTGNNGHMIGIMWVF